MKTKEEITSMHWKNLEPHPNNPRTAFPAEQVQEMSRSIAAQGILQPLVCVPLEGGRARIVMGHVRWQGTKALGAAAPLLPVRLVDWDENRQMLAMITENMARYDLDPIAEARYLAMLKETLGMTNEEVSEATGLGSSTIRDRLQLLCLPSRVQELISVGKLPPSAGRPLLQIGDDDEMAAFAQKCAEERVSVTEIFRAVEALPAAMKRSSRKRRREKHASPRRKPRIVVTTEILERYEGLVEVDEITKCVRIVCQQCSEEGAVCQQCPLTELVRLVMLQPGVREMPAEGEYVEDLDEWRGLSPRGLKVTEGHAPGWKQIV